MDGEAHRVTVVETLVSSISLGPHGRLGSSIPNHRINGTGEGRVMEIETRGTERKEKKYTSRKAKARELGT